MIKNIFKILGIVAVMLVVPAMLATGTPTAPPQAAGMALVFDDEFSTLAMNKNWYNPGIWWESSAPSRNISIINGAQLSLLWKVKQTPPFDTSIATENYDGTAGKSWSHGYIEVSAKFNPATGSWPAIWMMPIEGITSPNKEHGEIDILEWQSQTPTSYYGTIHDWVGTNDIHNNNATNKINLPVGTDFSQYHTYGVKWDSITVSWYFDNKLVSSTPAFNILTSQHYYLIIGQQIGNNWSAGGRTPSKSLTTNVDWVHVWQ